MNTTDGKDARQDRLGEALRANLQRRKVQARARKEEAGDGKSSDRTAAKVAGHNDSSNSPDSDD